MGQEGQAARVTETGTGYTSWTLWIKHQQGKHQTQHSTTDVSDFDFWHYISYLSACPPDYIPYCLLGLPSPGSASLTSPHRFDHFISSFFFPIFSVKLFLLFYFICHACWVDIQAPLWSKDPLFRIIYFHWGESGLLQVGGGGLSSQGAAGQNNPLYTQTHDRISLLKWNLEKKKCFVWAAGCRFYTPISDKASKKWHDMSCTVFNFHLCQSNLRCRIYYFFASFQCPFLLDECTIKHYWINITRRKEERLLKIRGDIAFF